MEDNYKELMDGVQNIRVLKALTPTSGKTPMKKLKNDLIELIQGFKEQYNLLPEEHKEKNKESKDFIVKVLEDLCLSINQHYINDEKEFIKTVFKDGKEEENKNLKPHIYYNTLD
jgi:hypothetical protein